MSLIQYFTLNTFFPKLKVSASFSPIKKLFYHKKQTEVEGKCIVDPYLFLSSDSVD